MTLKKFFALYSHYKRFFDIEMQLTTKGMTYSDMENAIEREKEWF